VSKYSAGTAATFSKLFQKEAFNVALRPRRSTYFGLRDYSTATWDGGDLSCDHLMPPGGTRNVGRDRAASGGTFHDSPTPQAIKQQYRAICGKCGAVRIDNQIGLEATPDLYIAALVEVFRGVRRVLRDDGVLWVVIGDSYINKQLQGMPWRVAFALQDDGWWLRSDCIWSKPNAMPESVTDRPTTAHEYLFLLSKQERYFYDRIAIAEPGAVNSLDTDAIREVQYAHETMLSMFEDAPTDGVLLEEERAKSRRKVQGMRQSSRTGVSANGSGQSICPTCNGEIQPQPARASEANSLQPDGRATAVSQGLRSVGKGQAEGSTLSTDGEAQSSSQAVLRRRQGTGSNRPLSGNTEGQGEPIARRTQASIIDTDTEHTYSSGVGGHQASPQQCVCVLRSDGSPADTRPQDTDLEGRAARQGEHNASVPQLQQSQGQPLRNRRSVWTVPTQSYKGAHFATFPEKLIEPCILAGSRPGDIVLDPFGGSGTTARVAAKHQRDAILIELNPSYIEQAEIRTDGVQTMMLV
jgi:DNA modification methylase